MSGGATMLWLYAQWVGANNSKIAQHFIDTAPPRKWRIIRLLVRLTAFMSCCLCGGWGLLHTFGWRYREGEVFVSGWVGGLQCTNYCISAIGHGRCS